MFYKASDTKTSTSDWISLNTDALESDLIVKAAGEEVYEQIEWVNRPEEPEEDDPDHDEWEEPYLHGGFVPAHSYVWTFGNPNDDQPRIREALNASGFQLFETHDIPPDFFFGVDGGGYSFMGAHWIPLRARVAASCCDMSVAHDRDRLRAILETLAEEAKREGEDLTSQCADIYEALKVAS